MRAPGAEAKVWPSIPGGTFQVAVITGGERSKTCGFTVQGKPAAEPGLARGEPALKLYLSPPSPPAETNTAPTRADGLPQSVRACGGSQSGPAPQMWLGCLRPACFWEPLEAGLFAN